MKKSVIITAIALCFSIVTANAKTITDNTNNTNVEFVFKVNSFCVSIAKGDIETVKKLIDRGADVNEMSNGMTPVMYAAKFNRTDILKLLIAKGANLKAKSAKKMTALKYAELHGANDAAAILKEAIAEAKAAKKRK
ncbi:ankyrin repeat domain-containing protein [Flavivirga spongiicola]|uniref:Ankyrin repeat domain-containing protein n=1 Tax=Flavivirga spongiicola TaxID=421621 RepID=A0ABU7XWW5_9FLAO|nr:ankyrin repeat domain-containing protein [Flavivirga sp. MEBiC05379]MDO5979910.1 ankyrin repeat domain-containing protein [Flavivirga sp. MEBiC05379]